MAVMENTVRLRAQFFNFDEELSDPTGVSLSIFRQSNNALMTSASPVDIIRESVGIYHYDYVVPTGVGNLYCVWSGTLEGTPIVNGSIITRELMSQ